MSSLIAQNIASLRQTLEGYPQKPQLIAVSKQQPVPALEEAIAAGQRDFGENYVREALEKWPSLKARFPDIRLHLLGHLQRNKLKEALGLFNVFHTLDRRRLAEALAEAQQAGTILPLLLIQVNTGEETQKHGIIPGELSEFLNFCQGTLGLSIAGLMAIPPADENPALHFALLKTLAAQHNLQHLSMGMSADYPTALDYGATLVRVGTALFGSRAMGA